MVDSMEPNHLEGEGLCPIVIWIPEGDGQINLLKRHGLLPKHDAMERCSGRSDVRSVDALGIKCLGLHDVEDTASIHQYLSEPLRVDDWVNHERISSQL